MEQPSRVVPSENNKDYDHIRIVKNDEDPVMKSVTDVKKAIASIDWAKSCVDMGWEWNVERVFVREFDDTVMEDSFTHVAYRIQTTFMRPDRDPPHEIRKGFGGWHEVPVDCTESAVIKRCFVAAEAILKHELMESLKWRGARPFDPHHTVRELVSIQGGRYTMSIP